MVIYGKISVSERNKKLFRKLAFDKYKDNNPELRDIRITENMVFEAMLKTYTGYVSLDDFDTRVK